MDPFKEEDPDAMQDVEYTQGSPTKLKLKLNLGGHVAVTEATNRSSPQGTSAAVGSMGPPPRPLLLKRPDTRADSPTGGKQFGILPIGGVSINMGSPTKRSTSGKQFSADQLPMGSPSRSTSGKKFSGPNSMAAQFPVESPRRSPIAGKRLPGMAAQLPPIGSPDVPSTSGKQLGVDNFPMGAPNLHSTSGKQFGVDNFEMVAPRSGSGKQFGSPPLPSMISSGRPNNIPVDRSNLPSPYTSTYAGPTTINPAALQRSHAGISGTFQNKFVGSASSTSTTETANMAPKKKTVKIVKKYQPPAEQASTSAAKAAAPKKTAASKKAAVLKATAPRTAEPQADAPARSTPKKEAIATTSDANTTGSTTPTKKSTPASTNSPKPTASGRSTPTQKSPTAATGPKTSSPSSTTPKTKATSTTTGNKAFSSRSATPTQNSTTTTADPKAATSDTATSIKKPTAASSIAAAPKKKPKTVAAKKKANMQTSFNQAKAAAQKEPGEEYGIKAEFDGRMLRITGLPVPTLFQNAPPSSPNRLSRQFPAPFENKDLLNPLLKSYFGRMEEQSLANPVGYWAGPLFHAVEEMAQHLEGIPGPHDTQIRPEMHGIFANPHSTAGLLPGFDIRPLNGAGPSAPLSGPPTPQAGLGESSNKRGPQNPCSPFAEPHDSGAEYSTLNAGVADNNEPGTWKPQDPAEALDDAAFALFEKDLKHNQDLRRIFFSDPDNRDDLLSKMSFWIDMDVENKSSWTAQVKMQQMRREREEQIFAEGFQFGIEAANAGLATTGRAATQQGGEMDIDMAAEEYH